MVYFRPVSLAIVFLVGIFLALPLEAQTTATLNVSARVVEECTVRSKRELFRLARKLNDPGIIQRCSKGVSSRVSQRVVKSANLQPPAVPVTRISSRKFRRSGSSRTVDVVLVTVSY